MAGGTDISLTCREVALENGVDYMSHATVKNIQIIGDATDHIQLQ